MEVPFNRLDPATAERLALLLEELGEAQQIIGKILRHGYESYHPDDDPSNVTTNRTLLERELGDVAAAIELMTREGDLSYPHITQAMHTKFGKVQRYLHHQPETFTGIKQ